MYFILNIDSKIKNKKLIFGNKLLSFNKDVFAS